MSCQLFENQKPPIPIQLKASQLVSSLKLKIHNSQENIDPSSAKSGLEQNRKLLFHSSIQNKNFVKPEGEKLCSLESSLNGVNLSFSKEGNRISDTSGSGIGKLLRRVPSFSSRRGFNKATVIEGVTPASHKNVDMSPPLAITESGGFFGDSEYIGDFGGLQSCYQKFKSTNTDDLLLKIKEFGKNSSSSRLDDHSETFSYKSNFSFISDSNSSIEYDEKESDDNSSLGLFANYNFDQLSLNSDVFTAFLETSTIEDKDQEQLFTKTLISSGIVSKLIKALHTSGSKNLKLCGHTESEILAESSENGYTPVEFQVPIFRRNSCTIPQFVSDIVDGKKLDTPFSVSPDTSSPDTNEHIKFNKNANLFVYNGKSSCISIGNSQGINPSTDTLQSTISDTSFYALNTNVIRGVNDLYVLKRSTSSKMDLWERDEETVVEEEGMSHSILKKKVNENEEDETIRARRCDFVDFDQFIKIFEYNERMRMLQEPNLSALRQQQIFEYYNSLSDDERYTCYYDNNLESKSDYDYDYDGGNDCSMY